MKHQSRKFVRIFTALPRSALVALIACVFACARPPAESSTATVNPQVVAPFVPNESCFARSILEDYDDFSGGPASPPTPPPPKLQRDAYIFGAFPTEGVAAQQLVELARVYRRVCINDLRPWSADSDQALLNYFLDHPDEEAFLRRMYTGFMGKAAHELPKNLGDVDLFFVAPAPQWVTASLAKDIDDLTGLEAHAFVLVENSLYSGQFGANLATFPGLSRSVLFDGFSSDFTSPAVVTTARLTVPIRLASDYHRNTRVNVVALRHERANACP